MKDVFVSVIIRTKNEEKYLTHLLQILRNQTYNNFEIILVDNESEDQTLTIATKHKVDKIITIPKNKFTHPSSLNTGIVQSSGSLIVITNGHCIPLSTSWIENGISNFSDEKVAAVYGYYENGPDGTLWQKEEDKKWQEERKKRTENGEISNTNSIIRRDLWEAYHFDESLEECEDYDWSIEMKKRGYKIVRDPRFNIIHNHPLTQEDYNKRVQKWQSICTLINRRKEL